MEMIRKDCHYLLWGEQGEVGINPFGIVQVGCGLLWAFPSLKRKLEA